MQCAQSANLSWGPGVPAGLEISGSEWLRRQGPNPEVKWLRRPESPNPEVNGYDVL